MNDQNRVRTWLKSHEGLRVFMYVIVSLVLVIGSAIIVKNSFRPDATMVIPYKDTYPITNLPEKYAVVSSVTYTNIKPIIFAVTYQDFMKLVNPDKTVLITASASSYDTVVTAYTDTGSNLVGYHLMRIPDPSWSKFGMVVGYFSPSQYHSEDVSIVEGNLVVYRTPTLSSGSAFMVALTIMLMIIAMVFVCIEIDKKIVGPKPVDISER